MSRECDRTDIKLLADISVGVARTFASSVTTAGIAQVSNIMPITSKRGKGQVKLDKLARVRTIIELQGICTQRNMEKLDRITLNPNICLGQPTIRGMRITVSVILKMLANSKSVAEVLQAYPELEVEDIQQALKYAAWVVSDQIQIVPTA